MSRIGRALRALLFWGLLLAFAGNGLSSMPAASSPSADHIGWVVGTAIGLGIVAQVLHRAIYGRWLGPRSLSSGRADG